MSLTFYRRAVFAAGAFFLVLPAHAERLDKSACDALKAEEATLVTAGVKSDLERGPEWAKSNLAPDRMQQIARLIEVSEQLSFRCRDIKAPPRPAAAPGAAAAVVPARAEPKDEEKGTGATKPAPKKPQTAAGTPSAAPKPPPAVVKPKPIAKPAPKPKVQQPPAQVRTKPPAPPKPGLFSIE